MHPNLKEAMTAYIYFLREYGCRPVMNNNNNSLTIYVPHVIQGVKLEVVYCPFYYQNKKIEAVNVY